MEFRHLQYFVVSADAGSFLRASKILFTTQSHISKAMKSLEEEIGCPLFVRKKNGVVLTEKGTELYAVTMGLLADYGKVERLKRTTGRPCFRVGFSQSLSLLPLPGLYARFAPECLISSRSEPLFPLLPLIHEMSVTLGLVTVYEWQRTRLEIELLKYQLCFVPLTESYQAVWLRQEHPMAALSAMGREELAALSFAETESPTGSLVERGATPPERRGARYEQLRVLTGSCAELLSVLRNSDLAYLGCEPFPGLLAAEGICAVPMKEGATRAVTGFLYRRDLPLPGEAEAFCRFVEAQVPGSKDCED